MYIFLGSRNCQSFQRQLSVMSIPQESDHAPVRLSNAMSAMSEGDMARELTVSSEEGEKTLG